MVNISCVPYTKWRMKTWMLINILRNLDSYFSGSFFFLFIYFYFMHGNFTVYATLEQFLGGLHLASAILLLVSLNDVHVCMIYDRIKLCQE